MSGLEMERCHRGAIKTCVLFVSYFRCPGELPNDTLMPYRKENEGIYSYV